MAGKHWLWLTMVAVVAIVAYSVIRSFRPSPPQGQAPPEPLPRSAIAISIASSNTKEDWLREAVHAFNDAAKTNKDLQVNGHPVYVEVLKEVIDGKPIDYRSGTMVSDTVKQKIKPTIISPGEESWLVKFKKDWQIVHNSVAVRGDAPVLVRTPLVVAMWSSRAKALGCWPTLAPDCTWKRIGALASSAEGWKLLGHPEWGPFKFGYGYFGESNSGTLGVISMCMAGVTKTRDLVLADVGVANGCGKVIAGVESAKVHSGKSDVWLLDRMIQGGPEYLDAVITYESNVILMNRKHASDLREPLVSVYPQDGTVVVGHPFAILDSAPWVTADDVKAAKLFEQFLLSPGQQQAVLQVGLRPADQHVKLGSPIEEGLGANPQATLLTLAVPDTLVIDRVGEVWRSVKKKAIIAIPFDKSGSMSGEGKIGAAIKGAQEFVRSMDLGDQLLWIPFDATVYTRTRGRRSEVGEQLTQEIAATPASGGTALYDAILTAVDELEKLRKTHADMVRYGIVVLSDGHDMNSQHTLTMLQERLKPQEHDPRGFQIHTICIGSDCDEAVLKKIAAAAHGKFWKGKSAADMVTVYKEIATHY